MGVRAFYRGARKPSNPPQGVRTRPDVPAAVAAAVLSLFAIAVPQIASAGSAIFSYTDDQGVTHFTNRPHGDKRFQRVIFREDSRILAPRSGRTSATTT